MYKKVLVPLDGSDLAECALSHVKNLVKDGSIGEITLLNAVLTNFEWERMEDDFNYNAFRNALFNKSAKYLADARSRLNLEEIDVKMESIEGSSPARIIAEYSKKSGMDLIVMSTHGRTGMRHLMFGSVALGVLHDAHVPVLLIRPEACRV